MHQLGLPVAGFYHPHLGLWRASCIYEYSVLMPLLMGCSITIRRFRTLDLVISSLIGPEYLQDLHPHDWSGNE